MVSQNANLRYEGVKKGHCDEKFNINILVYY